MKTVVYYNMLEETSCRLATRSNRLTPVATQAARTPGRIARIIAKRPRTGICREAAAWMMASDSSSHGLRLQRSASLFFEGGRWVRVS